MPGFWTLSTRITGLIALIAFLFTQAALGYEAGPFFKEPAKFHLRQIQPKKTDTEKGLASAIGGADIAPASGSAQAAAGGKNGAVRAFILDSLRKLAYQRRHEKVLLYLRQLAWAGDDSSRQRIMARISLIKGEGPIQHLIAYAGAEDYQDYVIDSREAKFLRLAAIRALGDFEAKAEPVIGELVKILNEAAGSQDSRLALAVIEALDKIGVFSGLVICALIDALILEGPVYERISEIFVNKIEKTGVYYLIMKGLQSSFRQVRLGSVKILGALGLKAGSALKANETSDRPLTSYLSERLSLNYEEQDVRMAIAETLGMIGIEAIKEIPYLQAVALSDRSTAEVILAAITALGNIGHYLVEETDYTVGVKGLAAILEKYDDENNKLKRADKDIRDIKLAAIEALEKIGPAAEGAAGDLARILAFDRYSFGAAVEKALVAIKAQRTVDDMLEILNDPRQGGVRRYAARILGKLGVSREDVLNSLVDAAVNPRSTWYLRLDAVKALGSLRVGNERSIGALKTAALSGSYEQVQLAAVEALYQIAVNSPQAIDALIEASRNNYPEAGGLAIERLCQLSKDIQDKDALDKIAPVLIDALKSQEEEIQQMAVLALLNLAGQAVPYLAGALSDDYNIVRQASAEILCQFASNKVQEVARATEQLIARLSAENKADSEGLEIIQTSMKALGLIANLEAAEAQQAQACLEKVLDNGDLEIKLIAILELSRIDEGNQQYFDIFVAMLKDEYERPVTEPEDNYIVSFLKRLIDLCRASIEGKDHKFLFTLVSAIYNIAINSSDVNRISKACKTLDELLSRVGSITDRAKIKFGTTFQDMTEEKVQWFTLSNTIEEAIRRLLERKEVLIGRYGRQANRWLSLSGTEKSELVATGAALSLSEEDVGSGRVKRRVMKFNSSGHMEELSSRAEEKSQRLRAGIEGENKEDDENLLTDTASAAGKASAAGVDAERQAAAFEMLRLVYNIVKYIETYGESKFDWDDYASLREKVEALFKEAGVYKYKEIRQSSFDDFENIIINDRAYNFKRVFRENEEAAIKNAAIKNAAIKRLIAQRQEKEVYLIGQLLGIVIDTGLDMRPQQRTRLENLFTAAKEMKENLARGNFNFDRTMEKVDGSAKKFNLIEEERQILAICSTLKPPAYLKKRIEKRQLADFVASAFQNRAAVVIGQEDGAGSIIGLLNQLAIEEVEFAADHEQAENIITTFKFRGYFVLIVDIANKQVRGSVSTISEMSAVNDLLPASWQEGKTIETAVIQYLESVRSI